jgi:hypothetical protein
MGNAATSSDWLNVFTSGLSGFGKTAEQAVRGKDLNKSDWGNLLTLGVSGAVKDSFKPATTSDSSGSSDVDNGTFAADVQGIKKRKLSNARGYLSTISKRTTENNNGNGLLSTTNQGKTTLG